MLINAHYYHNSIDEITIYGETIYTNNYEHIDIRAWLNNDFCNYAFSLKDEQILETEVDNSHSSTELASNDKFNKVFLLSDQAYDNGDYRFNPDNDNDRQAKPTDYARARGTYSSATWLLQNHSKSSVLKLVIKHFSILRSGYFYLDSYNEELSKTGIREIILVY